MMKSLWLKIALLSDTTFGRGDGVAGLVDAEVQHDEYGLPFISGKTLKGLLGAECAEIMFALRNIYADGTGQAQLERWYQAANFLFGGPGSDMEASAKMFVGDARLPKDFRDRIAWEFQQFKEDDDAGRATRRQSLLESLTALRRQTAMSAISGAPQKESLRTMRVILCQTPFEAELRFLKNLEECDDAIPALLAACVKSLRRAGTGRNRGRGKIKVELYADRPSAFDETTGSSPPAITSTFFAKFVKEVSQ